MPSKMQAMANEAIVIIKDEFAEYMREDQGKIQEEGKDRRCRRE
jgi:hypothetical protein